jgi:hypothetical protein
VLGSGAAAELEITVGHADIARRCNLAVRALGARPTTR